MKRLCARPHLLVVRQSEAVALSPVVKRGVPLVNLDTRAIALKSYRRGEPTDSTADHTDQLVSQPGVFAQL